MRDVTVPVAVALLLVLAGCATSPDATVSPTPSGSPTERPTPTPTECARAVDETTRIDTTADAAGGILSVSELYARIGTADCRDDEVGLYYVSENGTWYRAGLDGSIRAPAPEGNDSRVAPVEFRIEPAQRPAYVWQRYDPNDCPYTHFYNATDGRHLGWIPVPCPTPTAGSGSGV